MKRGSSFFVDFFFIGIYNDVLESHGKTKLIGRLRMKKLATVLMIILGNATYALAVKLFVLPMGLITGGTTGIALTANRYLGIPISGFVLFFNVLMLLVGLAILGKKFAMTTIISSFAYPAALQMFDYLLGDVILTEDLWLCTVFAGLGVGVGLGIVIRLGASTGGMDIPPLVLNHYFKIPVSTSLYVFDCLILLSQAFYSSIDRLLYGIVMVLIYSFVLDKLLLMGTTRTEVKVVSRHYGEIREAILSGIDRGVTLLSAEGGFMGEETRMIFSVVSNRELPKLEKLIHEVDPDSFMVVSRVSEVRGRGFTEKKEYRERKSDA